MRKENGDGLNTNLQDAVYFRKNKDRWKDVLLYMYKGLGILGNALVFTFFCVLPFLKSNRETVLLLLLFSCAYMLFAKVYDAFELGMDRVSNLVFSKALSLLIVHFGMYIIMWGMLKHAPRLIYWGLAYVAALLLVIYETMLGNRLYLSLYPPAKAALVYRDRQNLDVFLETNNPKLFSIEKTLHADELDDSLLALEDVEVVFLCDVSTKLQRRILEYSSFHDTQVYLRPRISDVLLSGARRVYMNDLPMLTYGPDKASLGYEISKRAIDIIASAIMLVVTSPVMLVASIAIKATDGGEVLYRQTRLTRGGKQFSILKFRSMRMDAEGDGKARLASVNDDRITPIGKFIRATRIDELPQLVNIIRGDMSLVGPRPERPEVAAQYVEKLPEFHLRLQVKAGLTGYAQVYGKYNTEPHDKLQMDLMYIAKRSLLEDLKLMFATVKILFRRESTQGVKKGATTAIRQQDAIVADDTYTVV